VDPLPTHVGGGTQNPTRKDINSMLGKPTNTQPLQDYWKVKTANSFNQLH